jgi:hypothetical protein
MAKIEPVCDELSVIVGETFDAEAVRLVAYSPAALIVNVPLLTDPFAGIVYPVPAVHVKLPVAAA